MGTVGHIRLYECPTPYAARIAALAIRSRYGTVMRTLLIMKESVRKYVPVRAFFSSLKSGSKHSFRTIMDANVTNLIARYCSVLRRKRRYSRIRGYYDDEYYYQYLNERIVLQMAAASYHTGQLAEKAKLFRCERRQISVGFKKQYDFVKNRNKFFIISIALLVIGLSVMLFLALISVLISKQERILILSLANN